MACCVAASSHAAEGWGVQVVEIQIDGRAAESVSEVAIILAGKTSVQMRVLKIETRIEQGAEIVVPRRTLLVLQSTNGNQVRLQPGSRFKINVVSAEGETYTLLVGKAFFKVSRALNFFNVNYQSFLAIVRGTEFDMAVEPEKEIRFQLAEGRLVVQREVKVKILEGDKVAQLTAREILAQGKKTQVSYRLGVEEYLKEFKTFKDAEGYFRRQLQEDEKSGEYERIQQGLNDLGQILVTLGKPKEATGYFERALQAARERRDEAWEGPLLNNLGVVHRDLGEYRKAIGYHERALALRLNLSPETVCIRTSRGATSTWELSIGIWTITAEPSSITRRRWLSSSHSTPTACIRTSLRVIPTWVVRIGLWLSTPRLSGTTKKRWRFSSHSTPTACIRTSQGVTRSLAGVAHKGSGEYRKAIEYYEKALAIQLKIYPSGVHPAIATSYSNLGDPYYDLGEYRRAIEYYDKSLALRLRLYPEGMHPDIAISYIGLGNAYCRLSEYRMAIEYYEKRWRFSSRYTPTACIGRSYELQ